MLALQLILGEGRANQSLTWLRIVVESLIFSWYLSKGNRHTCTQHQSVPVGLNTFNHIQSLHQLCKQGAPERAVGSRQFGSPYVLRHAMLQ